MHQFHKQLEETQRQRVSNYKLLPTVHKCIFRDETYLERMMAQVHINQRNSITYGTIKAGFHIKYKVVKTWLQYISYVFDTWIFLKVVRLILWNSTCHLAFVNSTLYLLNLKITAINATLTREQMLFNQQLWLPTLIKAVQSQAWLAAASLVVLLFVL